VSATHPLPWHGHGGLAQETFHGVKICGSSGPQTHPEAGSGASPARRGDVTWKRLVLTVLAERMECGSVGCVRSGIETRGASKTGGCRFESCRPCGFKPNPRGSFSQMRPKGCDWGRGWPRSAEDDLANPAFGDVPLVNSYGFVGSGVRRGEPTPPRNPGLFRQIRRRLRYGS
jgi:hypothetical protein